jgi:glutamate formiminotransferase/formiminotetrahydrofolate cyclodeaminase
MATGYVTSGPYFSLVAIVECVPNFSEGRRQNVIDAIANAARNVENVRVLDVESDYDHNRMVLTFVGDPDSVLNAAFASSEKAVQLIDLNKHKGQHPRMGAVDVVPFVPIRGIDLKECVLIARRFASRFAEKFHIPVFLYEAAATRPERKDLSYVRHGEFEGLRDLIGKDPTRTPDFGPAEIHPTAGATAVGARPILIAYNINLGTSDLSIAKSIAREVRGRNGGLTYVKALGFELRERGLVQVSMNMTDYTKTQLYKSYELVSAIAHRYGVNVVESEIVGLVPLGALVDCAEFYLKLRKFSRDQVIENRLYGFEATKSLTDESLEDFSHKLASESPTPGGGSAAAYTGAMAASLVSMVCKITISKKSYEKIHDEMKEILSKCYEARRELLGLVQRDSAAFNSVLEAMKLPKGSEKEREMRNKAIQEALKEAAKVPFETMNLSRKILGWAAFTKEKAPKSTLSDSETAAYLAEAAMKGAISNIEINLQNIEDTEFVDKFRSQLLELGSKSP